MGILKFNTGTFKLVNAQQSKHRSKGVLSLGIDASEEASKREVTLRNEQLMTRVLETPETAILCTIQAQECSVHFLIYCFFLFFLSAQNMEGEWRPLPCCPSNKGQTRFCSSAWTSQIWTSSDSMRTDLRVCCSVCHTWLLVGLVLSRILKALHTHTHFSLRMYPAQVFCFLFYQQRLPVWVRDPAQMPPICC